MKLVTVIARFQVLCLLVVYCNPAESTTTSAIPCIELRDLKQVSEFCDANSRYDLARKNYDIPSKLIRPDGTFDTQLTTQRKIRPIATDEWNLSIYPNRSLRLWNHNRVNEYMSHAQLEAQAFLPD